MEEVDLGIEGVTGAVQIGRGGFAAVYRARQPDFHREVAVKIIILPSLDEPSRNRFRRECRAIGSLSGHPNIVSVHQSGFTPGGLPYLIMDFVANGSLEDALLRDGPMPWSEAAVIGVKIARTLEFAHQRNLLHRDVKPANILVSSFGEPQLADFGVAWAIDASGHSASAFTTGTPAYAAPETWTNVAPTVAGDIYSLGATLHALITGEPPFMATSEGNVLSVILKSAQDDPPDLRPLGVPSALCETIEWAMAKEPSRRPASAEAFARALESAVTSSGVDPAVPVPASHGTATRSVPDDDVATVAPTPPSTPPPPAPPSPLAPAPSPAPDQAAPVRPRPRGGATQWFLSRRRITIPLVIAVVVVGVAGVLVLRPSQKAVPEGPARLRSPKALALDRAGDLYVADYDNNRILRVDPNGRFTTFAGTNGPDGGDGGPATSAVLSNPQAVAVDPTGNVFVAAGGVIRKVTPTGVISTVPVHLPGANSSNAIDAQFLVVDPHGGLVVATGTDVVHIGDDGNVDVVAGNGEAGFGGDGQPAVAAKLNSPVGLAFGPDNALYIADSGNGRIRKITADGTMVTVVGPGGGTTGDGGPAMDAALSDPVGVAFDAAGDMFIAESGGDRVRRVDATTQVIQTIAGSADGNTGFAGDGGPAKSALFSSPQGIAIAPSGVLYVIDGSNNRVRRISADLGNVTTIA